MDGEPILLFTLHNIDYTQCIKKGYMSSRNPTKLRFYLYKVNFNIKKKHNNL
ncbi:hypothetical protein WR164_15020 [Philodulcilactobacillus myokoensis]|uniref:Uncharacterized protein n=1 Tax=Philodulcilactobacillus myokoensis TaxID=2929573 RepID=A0A9W6B2S9_9LACO|nr:hypothetical protein WR164_15020 [Philodulcilactobacillus myokoensis]